MSSNPRTAAQKRIDGARARLLELADFHRGVGDGWSEAAALRAAHRIDSQDAVMVLCAESLSVITVEGQTFVWAWVNDEWRLPSSQFGFTP